MVVCLWSGEDARVLVRGDRGVPGDAGRSLSLLLCGRACCRGPGGGGHSLYSFVSDRESSLYSVHSLDNIFSDLSSRYPGIVGSGNDIVGKEVVSDLPLPPRYPCSNGSGKDIGATGRGFSTGWGVTVLGVVGRVPCEGFGAAGGRVVKRGAPCRGSDAGGWAGVHLVQLHQPSSSWYPSFPAPPWCPPLSSVSHSELPYYQIPSSAPSSPPSPPSTPSSSSIVFKLLYIWSPCYSSSPLSPAPLLSSLFSSHSTSVHSLQ